MKVENIKNRSLFLSAIRSFFLKRDYIEVDTPLITNEPGFEPYLTPYETTYFPNQGVPEVRYLITSPELYIKRLLSKNIGNVFQLSKCFRNREDNSSLHSSEFTMLEWYECGSTYIELMDTVELLVRELCKELHGEEQFVYKGNVVNLGEKWARVTVSDAFLQFAEFDILKYAEHDDLFQLAKKKGYKVSMEMSWNDLFFMIFLNEIEPNLGIGCPVLLYDWPSSMSALAKVKVDDNRVCERFELYIEGVELCNAFGELTDFNEQKKRVDIDLEYRVKKLKKSSLPYPNKFLDALNSGMPNSSGIALGVDRLLMLLLDSDSIKDVIYSLEDK
jgi:elongation factor P--(R)-beta-lysine ligase